MLQKTKLDLAEDEISGDHEEMRLGRDLGPEDWSQTGLKDMHPSLPFRLVWPRPTGSSNCCVDSCWGSAARKQPRIQHDSATGAQRGWLVSTYLLLPQPGHAPRQSCAATQSGRPPVAVSGVESLGTEGGVASSLVGQRKLKEQNVLDPLVFAFLRSSKATVVCAFAPRHGWSGLLGGAKVDCLLPCFLVEPASCATVPRRRLPANRTLALSVPDEETVYLAALLRWHQPAISTSQVGATVSQLTGGSCL